MTWRRGWRGVGVAEEGVVSDVHRRWAYVWCVPAAAADEPEQQQQQEQANAVVVEADEPEQRTTYQNFKTLNIQPDWTPIFVVQRTFLMNHNQINRTQFPLHQCTALTVHSSQGGTFKEIVIDLQASGRGNFMNHIHYVALGRVTTMHGLHILILNEQQIRTSKAVKDDQLHSYI